MKVWLVVAAVAFGLLDVLLVGTGPPAGLALSLLVDASLVLLARFPRTVGVLTVGVTVAMLLEPVSLVGSLSPATVPRAAPLVIGWLVAGDVDRRFAFTVTGILALLGAQPWAPSWSVTPFALLSTIGPALLTMYLLARRELLGSLRDRAERAEREQRLLAEQARAEERRRLAEDMHDVVTHRLSLIVLQAGALGVTSTDEAVTTAAEDIRTAGAQALEELRDLVGVLRTPGIDRRSGRNTWTSPIRLR